MNTYTIEDIVLHTSSIQQVDNDNQIYKMIFKFPDSIPFIIPNKSAQEVIARVSFNQTSDSDVLKYNENTLSIFRLKPGLYKITSTIVYSESCISVLSIHITGVL